MQDLCNCCSTPCSSVSKSGPLSFSGGHVTLRTEAVDGRNNRNSSISAVGCVKFVHQSSGLQISFGTLPHGAISMLGQGFLQNGWKK